jgi:formate dehydrogenase assembly factor FdhD
MEGHGAADKLAGEVLAVTEERDEIASVEVTVASSRVEAELLAGLLRSNGIRAVVSADDAGGLEPQWQLEGVSVLVNPSDEAEARSLLADTGEATAEH